jgi:hypothetical protein
MELLSEHNNSNENNFFHLLDEAQSEWKDRLQHLEEKGMKRKKNIKDQMNREIDVLNFKIDKESKDKETLEKQVNNED